MKKYSKNLLILAIAVGSCFALSANAAEYLADVHMKAKVSCESCHGTATPETDAKVPQAKCIACHGDLKQVSDQISKKRKVDPDPHWGHMVALDCNECHRGHQAGYNMCSQCHNLDYKVP
ncbi:cytochrome c3 family protein [Parasutterella sp.]|uniref:cytochrome c3 family protein n=1 Tax=Parasutterella sp. TaxID=2049037 RepID=UPI003AB3DAAD